jgi:hypothetical protein
MRISFDFDGVLCLTPFGRLAVHAPDGVPELPPAYERLYDERQSTGPLRVAIEYLRFGWRRMADDAPRVLGELSPVHELHIVTGRSAAGAPVIQRWLRARGLEAFAARVHMAPSGLSPAQHKLAVAKMLSIDAHIDDDPRTAYYLAEHNVSRVYLLHHAGPLAGDERPPNLTLVHSLAEFSVALSA